MKKKSSRFVEKLHHFSCPKCKKWWTVGDAPSLKIVWYCPWCGKINEYKKLIANDRLR